MTIWILEISGIFTVDTIRIWIKDEIDIRPYYGEETLFDDYVIVSRYDKIHNIIGKGCVLVYEDIFEKVTESIFNEIKYNYDFYYLYNGLQDCKKNNIDTLITGSSYGLHGIKKSIINRSVNLSLSSQDLYYEIKGIEEIVSQNSRIRNVVICCGYYIFFDDLSRTQDISENMRISKVFFARGNSLKLQRHFPKVAAGNSSKLHLPFPYPYGYRKVLLQTYFC